MNNPNDPKSGAANVPAASPEDPVRVYNRSTRQTFQHEVGVGDAKKTHLAPPSSFVTVPRHVAERWLRLFPEVVVDAGTAQQELGGVTAELATARAQLKAAVDENEKLKLTNTALIKELAELKATSAV